MRGSSVTRRYAKALFDLVDQSMAEATGATLLRLNQAISSTPSLRHVLASPAFSSEEKLAVLSLLSQKLDAPPVLNRFLGQLVKRTRITQLPEITEAFEALVDEAKGRRKVQIFSARALSRDDETQLQRRLSELLRHDVEVEFSTQPSLLSGLQIRIGSTVYDSTVRARLTAMQTFLIKE